MHVQMASLRTSVMEAFYGPIPSSKCTLIQMYPETLQIIAYFDEIEVCNPLGSRSGVHKLGK